MPKKFEEILTSIKGTLQGKTNPRTKKPYSESEIYAIAVSTYKKKTGNAPTRESSPNWYWDGNKEVRENVNINWNEVIEFDKSTSTSIDAPLVIKGRAINETISKNGIKYVSEELEKAAPTLIGKPLVNNHKHDDIQNIIGKVLQAEKVKGGIDYVAEIDPDERKIINKVKRGYINKVSICADCRKLTKEAVEEDGIKKEVYIAEGMKFGELSLVTLPGDEDSSANVESAISESFIVKESVDEFLKDDVEELKNEVKSTMVDTIDSKVKEMEDKLNQVLKEKSELSEKLLAIEAAKLKEAKEAEFKKAVAEEVAKELKAKAEADAKAKPEEDKKDEKKKDAEEADKSKGLVASAIKNDAPISEKLGESYSKMIIEQNRNGIDFWYMPKEAQNAWNLKEAFTVKVK